MINTLIKTNPDTSFKMLGQQDRTMGVLRRCQFGTVSEIESTRRFNTEPRVETFCWLHIHHVWWVMQKIFFTTVICFLSQFLDRTTLLTAYAGKNSKNVSKGIYLKKRTKGYQMTSEIWYMSRNLPAGTFCITLFLFRGCLSRIGFCFIVVLYLFLFSLGKFGGLLQYFLALLFHHLVAYWFRIKKRKKNLNGYSIVKITRDLCLCTGSFLSFHHWRIWLALYLSICLPFVP